MSEQTQYGEGTYTFTKNLAGCSVELNRNAKGDVAVAVKAYHESVEGAYAEAKALFDQACKDYPTK